MISDRTERYPLLCKGDVDGFFGLAVDNLVQVLVLVTLCRQMCGFSQEMLVERVLPGIAVSLLIGNLFYSWHAWRVARRDRNHQCTALPYGVNTVSLFAYIFFIMGPIYQRYSHTSLGPAGAAELAWKMGLVACIGSGIIEFLGAIVGGWIRRVTPRAALLSTLAAVGVIFIAGPFAFQIYERPLVAMLPMMIILVVYFARVRFPLGLPGGLVALIVGTILAWAIGLYRTPMMSVAAVTDSTRWIGLHTPHVYWKDLLGLLQQPEHRDAVIGFLGIIIPMGLLNALGSLQNIESAEAAGDRFNTGRCMAVNGISTIAAGLCGSCFPTTIYIGHPGWKSLGARTGYSVLNAVFFTLIFFLGLGSLVTSVIPMEAGIAIVLWIGIVITAQSYEATPMRHYAAVAIGFFPAVAALAVLFLPDMLTNGGAKEGILPLIQQHDAHLADLSRRTDTWWPVGIYALAGANSGFVVTCVLISAISAKLIDRQFKAAVVWSLIACVLTVIGLQHAYRIQPGPFELTPRELLVWQRGGWPEGTFLHRGNGLALGYAVTAVLFAVIHVLRRYGSFADLPGGGEGASATADDAGASRRLPAIVLMTALLGLGGLTLCGCGDPAAEMNTIRQKFEQIPQQADRRMVAFFLGLPYAETGDRLAWLFFTPPQGPLAPTHSQRMIVIRFDPQDKCTYREVLLWRRPQAGQTQLHYEISWSDPQRATDNDFWFVLQEKLKELSQSDSRYQLDNQPASYQFRAGDKLLVAMQRWQADPSRLLRVSIAMTDTAHPRVEEIIDLCCRLRVMSAGIEFDRPIMREVR